VAVLDAVIVRCLFYEVVCEHVSGLEIKEYHIVLLPFDDLLASDACELLELVVDEVTLLLTDYLFTIAEV
jgi:hypothetical protein